MSRDLLQGYIQLFADDGVPIDLGSPELLVALEARRPRDNIFELFRGREGLYWLISDRPGLMAAVLRVVVYLDEETSRRKVSYGINGLADSLDWGFERALEDYRRLPTSGRTAGRMPDTVYELARKHVAYRDALDPFEADCGYVQLFTPDELRRSLEEVPELRPEIHRLEGLIGDVAGRKLPAMGLVRALSDYEEESDLEGIDMDLLFKSLIPQGQQWYFAEKISRLEREVQENEGLGG